MDEKPGGSANVPAFGLDGGVELRSSTHCGGGGGGIVAAMMWVWEFLGQVVKTLIMHRGDVLPRRKEGGTSLHHRLPSHARHA